MSVESDGAVDPNDLPDPSVTVSPGFRSWLAKQGCGLVVSTYQTRRIISIGIDQSGSLKLTPREFGRCMGLAAEPSGDAFWLAATYQIWRFVRVVSPSTEKESRQLFLPQVAYTTGVLDTHDLAIGKRGRPVFCNTMFNCLSTTDEHSSFAPLWKPDFVSEFTPEDRCHLNGLAMDEGAPRYVTVFSKSNEPEGWKNKVDAGCVIDVQNPEICIEGLSQPHSPRLHNGRLWLLQSGTGEFGYVDKGKFNPLSFHAGYPRGLCFLGDHAIIGLSKDRKSGDFSDLPLGARLNGRSRSPVCGLDVVNLKTGATDFTLRFNDTINELYDVIALAGCPNPDVVGIVGDDIMRHYSVGGQTSDKT